MYAVLKLEKDVAGATLMAAGSSAPELATSMIGVFLVKVGSLRHITRSFIQLTKSLVFQDDIGLGAVVGSAVLQRSIRGVHMWSLLRPGYKEVLREEEGGMEQEEDEEREHGLTKRFLELISQPILWVLWMTCPDCRTPAWKSWYFITFLVSCVWIGLMTYLLVWMITIIGFTLSISDTVMALSLLAAGVSVPDAIASYLVVKKGLGDMAISNAVGSNVFDILLCMGLPWFVQTVAITPGQSVKVQSEATIDCPGLTYSTIALFSTVLFLVLTTHFNGWKLDRKHGFLMMGCYLGFMAFSLATEMATTTIPTCHSDY
ncbi:hypothetical protein LAZ67_1002676 [Cordylochernes scorpioides]|uniref:Sodium/calcium exchanger membrane region domain-containing protein n=1 Tax=Cordylochernes scorpioides TaxID=51811 RepID=A0ABY6JZR0_9ARAC|nr:hypothetical protein LAZ67_1002676 [Cordylochernes scorpioides]